LLRKKPLRELAVAKVEFGAKNKRQNKMKRSRFRKEQIIGILKEAEGEPVQTVCARHNVSQWTYYQWKNKYGGMKGEEPRRLRAVEDENARLKRVAADQAVLSYKHTETVPVFVGLPEEETRHYDSRLDYTGNAILFIEPPMDIWISERFPGTEIATPSAPESQINGPHGIDTDRLFEAVFGVPDPSLLKRVLVMKDHLHPEQAWVRQEQQRIEYLDADSQIYTGFGEAIGNGRIIVYRPGFEGDINAVINHEWNHEFHWASEAAGLAFDGVMKEGIEEVTIEGIEEVTNADMKVTEQWAYLGEKLCDVRNAESQADAIWIACGIPISSCIYLTALDERLSSIPAERRGLNFEAHRYIAKLIKDWLGPRALGLLEQAATSPDHSVSQAARIALDYLTANPAGAR
jgi:putative transposase